MRNSAMIKRNILLAFFSACLVFSITCPSVAYTSFPADSIRVKWMDGKKFILHKVEGKENWQNLSLRYNCTIEELQAANEGVQILKMGQIINVPISGNDTSEIKTSPVEHKSTPAVAVPTIIDSGKKGNGVVPENTSNNTAGTYRVNKGETMYSISKKFNLTVSEMKALNNLTSDILSEGQVLKVKSSAPTTPVTLPAKEEKKNPVILPPPSNSPKKETSAAPVQITPVTTTVATNENDRAVALASTAVSPAIGYEKPTRSISPVKKTNTDKTLMQITETGIATWISDKQVNPDKYYALHRSAPIGTIVKITNRMNNQFVYVKVVGSLPDTGDNENIIIKVSQTVSTKLNALDPLFQVELSYGMLN